MLVPVLSLLSLLSVTSARLERRATVNPTPSAPGDSDNGWQQLPDTPGSSKVEQDIGNYKFPLYLTSGLDESQVTRAVIVMPAKNRDCWNYWNIANNALMGADEANEDVTYNTVSIMAPCFLTTQDKSAGSASDSDLLFGDTTWVSGHESVAPDGAEVSSYTVIDDLLSYYFDTTRFPNMKNVVLAGHSAGAQLVQRYAALRTSTDNDDKIHYWVANPGSLLWLTTSRPYKDDSCTDYDTFKYGIDSKFPSYATSNAKSLGRDGIVEKYTGRNVHYSWGLKDDGNGDTRCQASVQGGFHLQRGQEYVTMLTQLPGGFPKSHTADWIEDASHDAATMMMSNMGMDKLFRFPYN